MAAERDECNSQRQHWDKVYIREPEKFGVNASWAAETAVQLLKQENCKRILELGSGEGRDSVWLAREGFELTAIDYSLEGIKTLTRKFQSLCLPQPLNTLCCDLRVPLPFADETFDACYSHLLYNMEFTTSELEGLSREIRRVLQPGGVNIYSARNTLDPDYGEGTYIGDDTYETDGYRVHFFSRGLVERLSGGYELLSVEEFEEGNMPKRAYLVTLRKPRR